PTRWRSRLFEHALQGFGIRDYNPGAVEVWNRQFGSAQVSAVTLMLKGDAVYVAGATAGTLPGQCSAGTPDPFVIKYNVTGAQHWRRQFGTAEWDGVVSMVSAFSGLYLTGIRLSPVSNTHIFLAKLNDDPGAASDLRPRISWECIVNAASLEGGGVSPGEIVTIFGSGIGPLQPMAQQLTSEALVATRLADTRVLFNGVPASILYASDGQTNVIVPRGLADSKTVSVQIEYRGVLSDAVSVPLLAARPGIFTSDGSGRGQALARNEDGSVNSG